jgi:hypothetical protein
MFRSTYTLATIVLALAAASCRSGPTDARRQEWDSGAGIKGQLTGYNTIVSAHKGKVGFLKTYDVTDFGGPAYPWKYVQNVDHKELGFIDQFGKAYLRHEYSPWEQAQQNRDARYDVLPSDSLENNVMRMLGIDVTTDRLTFPATTQADIAGDTGAPHLAGPGITPAPAAPAPAPAAAPEQPKK